jgi:hypothetical protein
MVISDIKLYELLKARLGEREAEAFVDILEHTVDKKFEDAKDVLSTKEDLAKAVGTLEAKIAQSETRMTMRMFLFWMGQTAVLASIMFAMLHAYVK